MRNVLAALCVVSLVAVFGCAGGSATGPSNGNAGKDAWSVYFGTPNNGLGVGSCNVVVPGGLCGQVMNVDSSGAFHEVWSDTTPNMLRADGTLTATTMSATLACVATSAVGSMSATMTGSNFSGTATLGGQSVAIRVVKGQAPCPS